MNKLYLNNIAWKEGKYFVAQCLNIEVSSFGATKKEALANLNEAIELYLEDTKKPVIIKIERPEFFRTQLSYA